MVSKKWDLLGKSCTTRSIHRVPLLAAFRRPTNLKDILVRAKLRQPEPQREPNTNVCLRPNTCRYCPKLNTDGQILCSASGRTYMSRYNVSCCSSDLIYCITCKRCGIQYVGQTKSELKIHKVARHFDFPHHKGLDDVMMHVVDFVYAAPDTHKAKYLRDLLEFNWIQRLHTNAPTGLNIMNLFRSLTKTTFAGHLPAI